MRRSSAPSTAPPSCRVVDGDHAALGEGPHTFQVRATDAAGNTDTTAACPRGPSTFRCPRRRSRRAPSTRRTRRRASFDFAADGRARRSPARSTGRRPRRAPPRSCTPTLATAPTPSPSGRPTPPVTPTPRRPPTRGPSTRGHRSRRSWRARPGRPDERDERVVRPRCRRGGLDVRVPVGRRRLRAVHVAGGLRRPGRGVAPFEVRATDAPATDASPAATRDRRHGRARHDGRRPAGPVPTSRTTPRSRSPPTRPARRSPASRRVAAAPCRRAAVAYSPEGRRGPRPRGPGDRPRWSTPTPPRRRTRGPSTPGARDDDRRLGPADRRRPPTATFAFSAQGPGATFDLLASTGARSPRAPRRQAYTRRGGGRPHFAVRATDAAGNVDASPATNWTVDGRRRRPDPADRRRGPGASDDGHEATFTFSASEAGPTFECRLDGAAFRPVLPRRPTRCGGGRAHLRRPGHRRRRQHRRHAGGTHGTVGSGRPRRTRRSRVVRAGRSRRPRGVHLLRGRGRFDVPMFTGRRRVHGMCVAAGLRGAGGG